MSGFINAILNPAVPFIRYALFAGILSSAAFGMIGSFVVVKRISYIAGAISHAVLAGIGIVLFVKEKYGIEWLSPFYGAVAAAIISALIISVVSLYSKEREDSVIGTIWAVGMGIGMLFIAKTAGYVDPMSYLFGNILLIDTGDLLLIFILDILIVVLTVLFYNQFLAISFDEEFARVRGLNTAFYHILLILLISLTVVLMVTIIGIVLVIALLTIPAAAGGLITKKLWGMMAAASLFCLLFTTSGLGLSYIFDLPTGSTTIIVAGITYTAMLIISGLIKKGKRWKKR